jgi:hypothetical protein
VIDEDSSVEPKAIAGSDHFDAAVLYDFSKFLTTLSLLALGGVLTLTQTADQHVIKKPVVAMVVSFIALAGISAFSAAGKLAKLGLSKRKERLTPQHYLFAAVAFLGMGAGGFLMMWWKSL